MAISGLTTRLSTPSPGCVASSTGGCGAGAAPAIDDLAEVHMRYSEPDFDAVLRGHKVRLPRVIPSYEDPSRFLPIMRSIGHVRSLITSGQTRHFESGTALHVRRALKALPTSESCTRRDDDGPDQTPD